MVFDETVEGGIMEVVETRFDINPSRVCIVKPSILADALGLIPEYVIRLQDTFCSRTK